MKLLKHYNEGCPAVVAVMGKPETEQSGEPDQNPQKPANQLGEPTLERMKEMMKIQGQPGNWDYNAYMFGMYNGMEMLMAIAEDREPEFKNAPEQWLERPQPTLPHIIPLVACPPELKYLASGHTVGLRIVGKYTPQGVEIEETELI